MAEPKLNDGIFHPNYNPRGWRCRWTGSDMILWGVEEEGFELKNQTDCFKPEYVYDGGTSGINYTSGRPDGLTLNSDGSSSFQITEW